VARPIIRPASVRKPIGLALQGGGSWGAYTWGVLDALLASRSITITQLSGTSAGALNAAVIASAAPSEPLLDELAGMVGLAIPMRLLPLRQLHLLLRGVPVGDLTE
jgi:predicted acylesterase/phospholipase RssA